jgi:predicted Ser/Thr protein kinase
MEDLTGKQLGKYQVVGALGEGGMAAVYKAYQPGMDRYVALKILPRHFASDPEFAGRFEQEAKLIAKLQHVHILPVYDFGEEDGYTYIVMPYVETGTLDDLLLGEALPLEQIRKIIKQVGEALSYAHSRGLVHRDVKPSNILIDEQGNCLLTDFGIAKMVEGTSVFTRTGAIIGTPEYMSPEQILGEKLDGRSDVYSLGIVLYEMATGRPPFRAETPPAVFVKHLHDPLPLPRTWNPDLPEAVEKVILKALAREPGDRFASATELVQALEKALSPEAQAKTQARVREQAFIPTVVEAPPIAGPKPGIPVRAEAEVRPKRKLPWRVFALGALGMGGIGVVLILGVTYLGPKLFGGEEPTIPAQTAVVLASPQTRSQATATSAPMPTSTVTPIPSPTPLPGSLVLPVDTLGNGIPWLPIDESARPGVNFVGFNTLRPPFNNATVRQAFAYAIDRESLAEMARRYGAESAIPATSLTPPETLGRDLYAVVGATFDPQRARDLLAQAGYSDPSAFPKVLFLVGAYGNMTPGARFNLATAMADMWATQLGVAVQVQVIQGFGAYSDRIRTDPPELFWYAWVADYNDPDDFLGELFYSGKQYNIGGFSNSEFDSLVDRARTSNSPAERQELYIQAERLLCETEAALIPIYHSR